MTMTRRFAKPFPVLLLLLLAAARRGGAGRRPRRNSAGAGRRPAALPAVDRALAKLSANKRLLVIGAHPDDEDTSLIAFVSRGLGGDAAYLSLSRGEGGQNVIGPELGPALGLLRTRELLAARAVDGGRQFFTRAYDFGYTRSLDETLRLWPKDVMVEDAVRVIRRFKPQVVVSVFPGVPHPNHGQHQAAGVTAYAAFPLAGDPNALPQLAAEGLPPWTPAGALPLDLLRSQRQHDDAADRRHRPAGRQVDLPARDGEPQHAPLAGHGADPAARPPADPGRLGAGGRGQGGEETSSTGIDTRLSALAATIADAGRRKSGRRSASTRCRRRPSGRGRASTRRTSTRRCRPSSTS